MSVATLELRMAGDEQDPERTFQAAEAGLSARSARASTTRTCRSAPTTTPSMGRCRCAIRTTSLRIRAASSATEALDEAGAVQASRTTAASTSCASTTRPARTPCPAVDGHWAPASRRITSSPRVSVVEPRRQSEHSLSLYVVGPAEPDRHCGESHDDLQNLLRASSIALLVFLSGLTAPPRWRGHRGVLHGRRRRRGQPNVLFILDTSQSTFGLVNEVPAGPYVPAMSMTATAIRTATNGRGRDEAGLRG